MTDKPLLSMIAHGTDGSDGLERGIHLRWSFHYKMGFPPGGFRLYRRESDPATGKCIEFGKFRQRLLQLPYEYELAKNQVVELESHSHTLPFESIKTSPSKTIRAARIERDLVLTLSLPFTKAEIDFFVPPGSHATVTALFGEEIVLEKSLGEKTSKPHSEKPGLKVDKGFLKMQSLNLEGPFDRLIFSGPLYVSRVCFLICSEEGDHRWEIINEECGFGLPNGIVPEGKKKEKAYRNVCDVDWEIVKCRLGKEKACDFEGRNFKDIQTVIGQINGDGKEWPVGWSLMSYPPDPEACSGQPGANLQITAYDVLLLESMNPDLARILGLYWVDADIEADKVYDYKVEASWPAQPEVLWKLRNEITFNDMGEGGIFNSLVWKDRAVLYGPRPLRMTWPNASRAEYGITFNYPDNADVELVFSSIGSSSQKPVREVQLFVRQQGPEATLAAYTSGRQAPIDTCTLRKQEGILAVHSQEPIERVRLQGEGVIIFRIHYDEEYIAHGKRSYVLCNARMKKPKPLGVPTGLKVHCLRGGAIEETATCELVEHRFSAGLTWDLPKNNGNMLAENMPISFQVRRAAPRGEITEVTAGSPVMVVREQADLAAKLGYEPKLETCAEKETVKARQLFRDYVDESGIYGYQIAGVDIFGRTSEYCPVETVDLVPPVPPPPSDVNAKFLDFSTYDSAANEFGDPNLTVEEKEWLCVNQTSGIVVRWRWTEQLRARSPEARGFRIHLKLGWLNVLQGRNLATTDISAGYRIETDIQQGVGANSLVGEWLRQDRMIYKVVANTAGPDPSITIEYMPDALGMTVDEARPRPGGFALPVSKPTEEGGAAVDYRDPLNWDGGSPLHEETINDPTEEYYQVFIPDPPFPDPPFVTTPGQYEQEKTRYAQIGVSTFSNEGEGSVSSPAAILAVDRRTPPPEVFQDSPGLKATPADYHGKSTFPLRWSKPLDPGVKYFVFRAMDETLFVVDWARRPRAALQPGDTAFFPASMTNAAQRQQICNELNVLNGFAKDDAGKAQAMTCYRGLSNNALKVLAGLEGMDQAFAKLHDKPIAKTDTAYQDRDTNVPAPGTAPQSGDPNKLLFIDNTLDGRGGNRYFYRIRPIDEIGNLGPLGEATLPVEIPAVTPVVAPVITNISGGDRQITVKWGGNPGAGILGYLVFRTDQKSVVDMRNMDLRKLSSGDMYSVSVTDQSKLEFEFTDSDVVPRTPYYFAVAAITAGEGGKKLLSRLSPIKSAQAYDLTPPDPPVWAKAEWILVKASDESEVEWPTGGIQPGTVPAIRLLWETKQPRPSFEISKQARGDGGWRLVAAEGDYEWTSSIDAKLIDKEVEPDQNYTYRIKAISASGIMSTQIREIAVAKPK